MYVYANTLHTIVTKYIFRNESKWVSVVSKIFFLRQVKESCLFFLFTCV